jgi:hypothetical protein
LSKADRFLAGQVTTHKTFDLYIKEATSNTTNTSQLAALQSISQIYRALLNFEYRIKESVEDGRLDTSSLWAMAYLNVKVGCLPLDIQLLRTSSDVPHQLSIESSNKLKKTNKWMTELRRKVELFNRCVEQCEDANSMRMEMSEIFDPLLAILYQSIKYSQKYNAGKLGRIPSP